MTGRFSVGLVAACASFVLVGAAGAAPAAAPTSAHALAVAVMGPEGELALSPQADDPPGETAIPTPFAYPADGSIVSAASTSVSASASPVAGAATATASALTLSLFKGEITADEVRGASASFAASGDTQGSMVTNLVVFGEAVTPSAGLSIALEDWGNLVVLKTTVQTGSRPSQFWRGAVTALTVHLDREHGGLPAGSEIRVGLVDALARLPAASQTTSSGTTAPETTTAETTTSGARADGSEALSETTPGVTATASPHIPLPLGAGASAAHTGPPNPPRAKQPKRGPFVLPPPPNVTPKLTADRYVFPVYGPAAYGDTFAAPRPDVSGGWHHGDDVFAPLGAPVLAVADGTVFSVGWNDVGGYRLWLRDRQGNEFYYAHLSAYTTLAVNGRKVKAGSVLGFVGSTGDAQGTPFHLHFEVHPVSMLFLGYDGAVNPTRYLNAWRRLEDVRILPAVGILPPPAEKSAAPPPGAILLRSTDISTASGLEPSSLRRAMNASPESLLTGEHPLADLPTPLPVLDRA